MFSSLLLLAAGLAGAEAPVRYEIRATLSATSDSISARAVIVAPRASLGGVWRLNLALGNTRRIHVLRVTDIGGNPAVAKYAADSSEIIVPLEQGSGDSATIVLEYRVDVDTTARRQLGYVLFGSTENRDAWYPSLLGVADSLVRFKEFDVTLDVSAGLPLIATGERIDGAAGGSAASRTLLRFHATHVEGFALAFGAGMALQTVELDGIRVRTLSSTEDSAAFRRVAEESARAAAWYRRTYGFFPVSEISVVPGYRGARGGYPLPNVFMIHRGDLSASFVRWITAHELAHYYWGLYVLDAQEPRLGWLMLGLGIWTDQNYLASTSGLSLPAQWRDSHADDSFMDFAAASIADYDLRLGLPTGYADSLPYDYNSLVRHGKGATGIYLLAAKLGRERFVALQRELLATYRDRQLSPAGFGAAAEAAGVPNAAAFLESWARPDARLDFAVRAVVRAAAPRSGYWIRIERTGTIPYPVTIESHARGSAPVRQIIAGEEATDSVFFAGTKEPESVRIDPDGLLPMWSSDNLEMRRVFLRALGAEGPVRPFVTLALDHLASDPDPGLAALTVERLFGRGDFARIVALAARLPAITACSDRVTCLAAIQVARAHVRLGEAAVARRLMARLEASAGPYGISASRRLDALRQELAAPQFR